MDPAIAAAVTPAMLAACVCDVRRRIIPDLAPTVIATAGLIVAVQQGLVGPAMLAAAVCGIVGGMAAATGLWGWGDAKLIGAAGLASGLAGLGPLLAGTAIVGGVLATLLLLLRPPVRAGRLALPAGAPRWLRAEQTRLKRAPSVPYALAIAAGLLLALLPGA